MKKFIIASIIQLIGWSMIWLTIHSVLSQFGYQLTKCEWFIITIGVTLVAYGFYKGTKMDF